MSFILCGIPGGAELSLLPQLVDSGMASRHRG